MNKLAQRSNTLAVRRGLGATGIDFDAFSRRVVELAGGYWTTVLHDVEDLFCAVGETDQPGVAALVIAARLHGGRVLQRSIGCIGEETARAVLDDLPAGGAIHFEGMLQRATRSLKEAVYDSGTVPPNDVVYDSLEHAGERALPKGKP